MLNFFKFLYGQFQIPVLTPDSETFTLFTFDFFFTLANLYKYYYE